MAWSDAARQAAEAARQAAAHGQGVDQVGKSGKLPPLGSIGSPESPESRELRLFADNDSDLYRKSFTPVVQNLGQKMDKGNYDPAKAEKLWGYHAERAAVSYGQQMGGNGKQIFSPAVRREAAGHWEREERDGIASGEHGNPYPAHQTKLRAAWDAKHGK